MSRIRNQAPGQVPGCLSWWHLKVMCKGSVPRCLLGAGTPAGCECSGGQQTSWVSSGLGPVDFQSITLHNTLKQDALKVPHQSPSQRFSCGWKPMHAPEGRGTLWQEAHHPAPLTSGPRVPSTKPIVINLEYERQAKPGMRIRVLFQVTCIRIKDKYLVTSQLFSWNVLPFEGRILWYLEVLEDDLCQADLCSYPVCHQLATCQSFWSFVSLSVKRLNEIEYIKHLA